MAQNGLGLAQPDAVANVRALRARLRFLSESDKVSNRLLDLLGDVACLGEQVHDANLVATMLTHGVDTLGTINVADLAPTASRPRSTSGSGPASRGSHPTSR